MVFIFVSCGRCDLLLQSKMSHDLKRDNDMTRGRDGTGIYKHENNHR